MSFTFNKKATLTLIFFCSSFQGLSGVTIEGVGRNNHDRQVDRDLGKKVFSFVHRSNGMLMASWFYTNELSRTLLVGEHWFFESARYWPIVNLFPFEMLGPLSDNRFENFVNSLGQFSQDQLQEAVKDTLFLTKYSTKAYSISDLLYYLDGALQRKIFNIKNQIQHNFICDREACRYMGKSLVLAALLVALKAIANRYIVYDKVNKKSKVTNAEFLDIVATLGLVPLSCKVLNGVYKVLATNPNAYNQQLKEYEDLLRFIQDLKTELDANGSIAFKLANGNTVALKNKNLRLI